MNFYLTTRYFFYFFLQNSEEAVIDLLQQLIKRKSAYNPYRGQTQSLGDITFVLTTTSEFDIHNGSVFGELLNFIPLIQFPDVW